MSNNKVKVDLHDLYQLLIAECRYGYTRRNHLMPGGAFDKVKKYVPLIAEQDKDYAIRTVTQLCDECIDYMNTFFYNGDEDEFTNRSEALEFIEWCLAFDHQVKPYNLDFYNRNKALDDKKVYKVYDENNNLLIEDFISKNMIIDILASLIGSDSFTYNKQTKKDDLNYNYFIYNIREPIERTIIIKRGN